MIEPLLQVSSATGNDWSDSIQVANGKQLTDVSYQITFNGNSTVRVTFPVCADKEDAISCDKALMTLADWNNISITADPATAVTVNHNNSPTGACDFTVVSTGVTTVIVRWALKGQLTVYNGDATANCQILYSTTAGGRTTWKTAASSVNILMKKDTTPPAIVKFTAKRIVVASDEPAALEWEVIDATSILIQMGDSLRSLDVPANQFKGSLTTGSLAGNTTFKLTATNDASSVTRSIIVKVCENNSLVPEKKTLFGGQKLMGLYPWGGKLFALILSSADQHQNVFLWESDDGLNWQKAEFYSYTPVFVHSSVGGSSTVDGSSAPGIDLDFAGSPGVIYKDKLYLIGGSRFDTDFRSNLVYYLDFAASEKGWQAGAPASFTPRMGHACVVYNKEIWVIGGYNEQGCSNEVWKFDGTTWTDLSVSNALPTNRCMLSAIINNGNIEIYGGFGNVPGVPDQTLADSYVFAGNSWTPLVLGGNVEQIPYVTCTVARSKEYNFIFSTVYTDQLQDRVQMLLENNVLTLKDILSSTDFGMQEYIFHIQAVDFNDVVWLCILTKTNVIKSNVLSYFVYVSKDHQL
jgi:hypothetical protein